MSDPPKEKRDDEGERIVDPADALEADDVPTLNVRITIRLFDAGDLE